MLRFSQIAAMNIPMVQVTTPEAVLDVPDGTFLLAYRGSVAHNMYVPKSDPQSIDDVDLMGFVIPDAQYYFGLRQSCIGRMRLRN